MTEENITLTKTELENRLNEAYKLGWQAKAESIASTMKEMSKTIDEAVGHLDVILKENDKIKDMLSMSKWWW